MKKFNLKQWRKKHGMTQSEFGVFIGLCRETIRSIENGKQTKTGPLVERVCKLYDIINERK